MLHPEGTILLVGLLIRPPPPPPGPPASIWDDADVFLLNFITASNAFFANAINTFAGIVGSIFKAAAGFLHTLWRDYVKVAINWLVEHMRKFREWLKRTLKPIIARLEKIKKWYDQHVLKQQLRQIQMIQRIRQFLAILRLLHVGWASKLDNALVDVQNRIEQDIAIVRGTLNQIINTLALALDPTLFISSNVLGGTLLGNLAAVKRIFGFGWHGPLTATETTQIEHNVGRYQESTANGHIATLASSGLTAYDQSEVSDLRKAFSDVTGQPSVL